MFTGIVTAVGEVSAVEPRADNLVRLTIACNYPAEGIAIGASIACSGACLTVVARGSSGKGSWFAGEAGAETLRVTTLGRWRPGTRVNLERALKLGEELGGHIVTGHVDGVGVLAAREDSTDMAKLAFRVPDELSRFIARKGSVAVDGISLTVNETSDRDFSVMIIPHTLEVTTLKDIRSGEDVNIEVDLMARYTARLLERA